MKNNRQIRYVGSSMNPALLQNDILEWVPVSERLPVPGDVIVFDDPAGSGFLIIHRVIRRYPDGSYCTRGDNRLHDDERPVILAAIRGVVIGGFREERPLDVPRGSAGMRYHLYAQHRAKLLSVLERIFSRPYRSLSHLKVMSHITPPWYRQRLVIIRTPEGHDLQVYLGRHLVGWKGEKDREWTILPPCRLFIDSAYLPDSPLALLGDAYGKTLPAAMNDDLQQCSGVLCGD